MLTLSKRTADETRLLKTLREDQRVLQFARTGYSPGTTHYSSFVNSIAQEYGCPQTVIEELVNTMERECFQVQPLSNRSTRMAQDSITIPSTSDKPARTIPLPGKEEITPSTSKVTIDATPAISDKQKVEDVSEAVSDDQESRQQQLINVIKAVKICADDMGKAMFGIHLTDENQGKVVQKLIETLASICADQTAETVQSLASPLIGGK